MRLVLAVRLERQVLDPHTWRMASAVHCLRSPCSMPSISWPPPSSSACRSPTWSPATVCEGEILVTFDYAVGLFLALSLATYLGYALVRPERF